MTPYESRMLELLDRLQATLEELRAHLKQGQGGEIAPAEAKTVEAFADEAFRARDA